VIQYTYMNQTITIDAKTMQKIIKRLDQLSRDMRQIKQKLLSGEPEEGSDEWWELSDKEAMEDIQKGDYYELKDKKELNDFFKNIRSGASNEKYHHKVRR